MVTLVIGVSIILWGVFNTVNEINSFFDNFNSTSVSNPLIQTPMDNELDAFVVESGYYETTEEIMIRIKQDVLVSGTMIDGSGDKVALFRIEGQPDRPFALNAQLMDGFIITKITDQHVILKNQQGPEKLYLNI